MRETACPSQGLRATAATVQIRNGCPQVGCLVWPAVWAGLGLSPHLLPQPGRPCEGHAHACIPPGGSGDTPSTTPPPPPPPPRPAPTHLPRPVQRQLAGHLPGQSLTLWVCHRTLQQGQQHVCLDCDVCSTKERDRKRSNRLATSPFSILDTLTFPMPPTPNPFLDSHTAIHMLRPGSWAHM